jgi:hypothetical protein
VKDDKWALAVTGKRGVHVSCSRCLVAGCRRGSGQGKSQAALQCFRTPDDRPIHAIDARLARFPGAPQIRNHGAKAMDSRASVPELVKMVEMFECSGCAVCVCVCVAEAILRILP